uniref:Uncharacterized protein n=1 Tax=Oryza barthii TaxID=65489 RepID=A0A0D3GK53_9ORYZ
MVAMTGCGWLDGWMTGQPQCHSSQLTPCVGWEQRDSMVTHCQCHAPSAVASSPLLLLQQRLQPDATRTLPGAAAAAARVAVASAL